MDDMIIQPLAEVEDILNVDGALTVAQFFSWMVA